METRRVNEEFEDATYEIQIFNPETNSWRYVTNEFSISVASQIMINLKNATGFKSRVLSNRSNNMVLSEV